MFYPALLNVRNEISFWPSYALATLTRALFYRDDALFLQWTRWAGGTTYSYIPSGRPTECGAVHVTDGVNNIFAFQGFHCDENWRQTVELNPVLRAVPPDFPDSLVHRYFYTIWREKRDWVKDRMASMHPIHSQVCFTGNSGGGAVAYLFAHYCKTNYLRPVSALITFGMPRVGTVLPELQLPPQRRWVTARNNPFTLLSRRRYDPVAQWPPRLVGTFNWPNQILDDNHHFAYAHNSPATVLSPEGNAFMEAEGIEDPVLQATQWYSSYKKIVDDLRGLHHCQNYVNFLYRGVVRETTKPPIGPLLSMNAHMDQKGDDAGELFNGPEPTRPSPATWSVPDLVLRERVQDTVPPPEAVGNEIEVLYHSHSLITTRGNGLMANEFRGHDRELLITLRDVCDSIKRRDGITQTDVPTHKISTRTVMFANNDDGDFLDAIDQVQTRAEELLALEKGLF